MNVTKKKQYQKPQIKEVKMIPQEAFLGAACKQAGGTNPSASRCATKPGCGNIVIAS